jgi:pimeloyl-ACP methyl ester carboxylesterase
MKRYANLRFLFSLLVLSLLFQASACNKDDDDQGMPTPDPEPEMVCDSTLAPIIFVHGFLASGDTYATQVQRFTSNRYCGDRLFAFDWNTLGNQAEAIANLDALIDQVLEQTKADHVHLAGHSAGGGLCYNYLADGGRAAKVARYVHIGSGTQSQPAGPSGAIPTANIWSEGDKVVAGSDIPGAENIRFGDLDHYEVATGAGPFAAMYAFFNDGRQPETTAIMPESEVLLSGRVVTLGENRAMVGASIEIYEVDPATGNRLRSTPDAALTADANGYWGPWEGKPNVTYAFVARTTTPNDRPIHYYREGFVRSNQLIYLRTFPPPTSLAGLLLAGIPRDDAQTALAVFTANQGVIHQRDALSVNDFDLATEGYASPERTSIAIFLYDDGDGQTSGNPHPAFNFVPAFLTGVDYFIPTEPQAAVQLKFNGRSLNVPNLKSASDGVIVAVFD